MHARTRAPVISLPDVDSFPWKQERQSKLVSAAGQTTFEFIFFADT